MSERIEKIADEILSVVTKKRTSGKTPENDVWVATYLPNREQIAVIFGDREVSNSYVQHRFKKDDRASVISTLEKLYGAEPRNHNEQSLDEDTVYDHSWYEVKGQKYPKRTKEGVVIKESYDEPIQVWNLELKKNPYISREEIFKAKEIFFKEICDHADEYPNFKELVKVLQSLLDKGIINDKQYKFCRTNWDDLFGEYDPDVYGDSDLTETTCAGSVACIGKRIGKIGKRKRKKVSEDLKSKLFKESILNDMPCETEIEKHSFKYFMNEGKWYMGVDNCLVKTHDKGIMMETFDQIVDELPVTTSLLEDYSCYEMELLMEEENTATSPLDTENDLIAKSPLQNNSEVDAKTVAIDAVAAKLVKDDKEKNGVESPQTSIQKAEYDNHLNDIKSSKNQKGVLVKDGKSKSVTINDTMQSNIQGPNGNNISVVTVTDEHGNKDYVKPEEVNTNQETL